MGEIVNITLLPVCSEYFFEDRIRIRIYSVSLTLTEYEYEYIWFTKIGQIRIRIYSALKKSPNIFGNEYIRTQIFEYIRILNYSEKIWGLHCPRPSKYDKKCYFDKTICNRIFGWNIRISEYIRFKQNLRIRIRIYSVLKNCRIYSETNIFGQKYSNIFEYRIIRYTLLTFPIFTFSHLDIDIITFWHSHIWTLTFSHFDIITFLHSHILTFSLVSRSGS